MHHLELQLQEILILVIQVLKRMLLVLHVYNALLIVINVMLQMNAIHHNVKLDTEKMVQDLAYNVLLLTVIDVIQQINVILVKMDGLQYQETLHAKSLLIMEPIV